ncbi:MAG: outer membrane protein assembly factor BamD [Ignavibacteria bacterium]
MMKKNILLFLLAIALYGCASTVNTANMTAGEHLNYALKLFNDEDYLASANEFQTVLMQFPGSSVVDSAQYYLAESHFMKQEYILAAYEYSRLIKDIPASRLVPKAQYMLAESYYQLSPDFQLEQKYTKKSIEEFQAFIDFFPTDPKVAEAGQKIKELNNKLAEKEMNSARIYNVMEYYGAALYYYSLVTDTYHDSKYATEAHYNKIKLYMTKKDKLNALKEGEVFIQKYPDDINVAKVKDIIESLNKSRM